MNNKKCGTCRWHCHEDICDGYICVCDTSEQCTEYTDDDYVCEYWEVQPRAKSNLINLSNELVAELRKCEDRNLAMQIRQAVSCDSLIDEGKVEHGSLCETETYKK